MATITESDIQQLTNLINSRFDEIKTEVQEIKTEVQEIKTDIAGLKMEVQEIKTDVAVFKTEIKYLKAENAKILQQIEIIQTGQRQLEFQLNAVQVRMDEWKFAILKNPRFSRKSGGVEKLAANCYHPYYCFCERCNRLVSEKMIAFPKIQNPKSKEEFCHEHLHFNG